ncbi:hypothetical protein EW145_g2109 [Phellinidium pouzarii]|uniref:Uncharacterized protein n=1 Tax=Phellinidium pouzarii TaxID=167371 RepID=A0A4S4LCJ3_9AGAM|nr:hypothetical protein EW145_g2109 [Phellinidium pouzarii]
MPSSKQLSLARVNDLVLGAFSSAPTSEGLDHAIRYLSTWSGSDKLFMIIQYALKIIIPFLDLRARLQHRNGTRKDAASTSSVVLFKLYSLIGDSRMLWRFWGLLPIYQWLSSLERMPPPTRELLTIERIQGWSMLLYYPLEHLYYLRANGLLSASVFLPIPFFKSISVKLNTTKLAIWSARAWALYVFLQFAHLRQDFRLLKLRERALAKVKGKSSTETEVEKVELRQRWDALRNEFVSNLGYLPLTIHWCVIFECYVSPQNLESRDANGFVQLCYLRKNAFSAGTPYRTSLLLQPTVKMK